MYLPHSLHKNLNILSGLKKADLDSFTIMRPVSFCLFLFVADAQAGRA